MTDQTDRPTLTPNPGGGVILHLPDTTHIDTQVWSVDVGLTDVGLEALRALLASPASQAPVDRAPLRDRIRRAICEAEGFAWDDDGLEPDEYGEVADAVLDLLPAPADRAAEIERLRLENGRLRHELEVMYGGAFDDPDRVTVPGWLLRSLADPEPCVWQGDYCSTHRWRSDVGRCPHGQAQTLLAGESAAGARQDEIPAAETAQQQTDIDTLARMLSAADVEINHGDYPTWDTLAESGQGEYRKAARYLLKRLHITARTPAVGAQQDGAQS